MIGVRLPIVDGKATMPTKPGEYCGPVAAYTNGLSAMLFLKPNARDPNVTRRARSIQHVCSPPHMFIEEPGGTLTITPSISDFAGRGSESDGWHGYLTKGEWKLA